jgi:OsmC subfamily peroxiredoxin
MITAESGEQRRRFMKINRSGSAIWAGGLKDGGGNISTQSGALKEHPYGFGSRFESANGTNPEELIAAGHAGCFTMALSLILGQAGFKAERMETKAVVTLEQVGRTSTRRSSRSWRTRQKPTVRFPSCSRPRSRSTHS